MSHTGLDVFLSRLRLRSELGQDERLAILDLHGEVARKPRRADIVLPGDQTTHSCLVVEGIAARFDQVETGARQYTALHVAGDMCDLHGAVLPTAAWGLEALTAVTLLRVPHTALLGAADRYSAIARAFWRDTTVDGSVFAKWAANLGGKSAQARFAHLICELGVRMEKAGLGSRTSYRFDITQDQLADALGLTSVHVNRTLQSLRLARLVRTTYRQMEVLDWTGLVKCAGFHEDYLQMRRPAVRTAPMVFDGASA